MIEKLFATIKYYKIEDATVISTKTGKWRFRGNGTSTELMISFKHWDQKSLDFNILFGLERTDLLFNIDNLYVNFSTTKNLISKRTNTKYDTELLLKSLSSEEEHFKLMMTMDNELSPQVEFNTALSKNETLKKYLILVTHPVLDDEFSNFIINELLIRIDDLVILNEL